MKKIPKFIFLVLFILFTIVFFNRGNNYYENTNIIGEDAIKQFEEDLKEGKEINPKNYITPRKNYNNRISRYTLKVSHMIEFVFDKSLKKLLKYIAS